jgi:hypothetical protein
MDKDLSLVYGLMWMDLEIDKDVIDPSLIIELV